MVSSFFLKRGKGIGCAQLEATLEKIRPLCIVQRFCYAQGRERGCCLLKNKTKKTLNGRPEFFQKHRHFLVYFLRPVIFPVSTFCVHIS